MANKKIFASASQGQKAPAADSVNEAGGSAYAFTPRHTLAQYVATGCLNNTYYTTAEDQLETILKMAEKVDLNFVAKTAVYCRERGFMKDTPAALAAYIAAKDTALLARIFPKVIDNGKMLRNFVQMVRSDKFGRKSFGTRPKKLVQDWIKNREDAMLFNDSVGNEPSLADIIKMVHPKPTNKARNALYAYMIGREYVEKDLPTVVKQFESYKKGDRKTVPDVSFQMLTALELGTEEWTTIAKNAKWHQTRMNLNTFARHGVFGVKGMTDMIADRLRDAESIKKVKVFPYQLLMAYSAADDEVPLKVKNALQDAMEIAISNVPAIDGQIFVCPDVSGSMDSPVTGNRGTATSKVTCIDVASLVAAAFLRKNEEAKILPFSDDVRACKLNPRDSVMTNAKKLASLPRGGTNLSAPLTVLNRAKVMGDLIVFVSDNESWMDSNGYGQRTEAMAQWSEFKRRNPKAKMVCIDITPNSSTQAKESKDIMNIGGFSDAVFDIVGLFASGKLNDGHWVGEIESVEL